MLRATLTVLAQAGLLMSSLAVEPIERMTYDFNHLGQYLIPVENVKGGVAVDIGGNTGMFELTYGDVFSVIHVYEPQPECFKIIKQRLSDMPHITLFNEAVHRESGLSVKMISHKKFDSGSVAVLGDHIEKQEWVAGAVVADEVPTVSLQDVLRRAGGHINFMKLDCETSEYNFLYMKHLGGIDFISGEFHHQLGKKRFDNLINWMLQYFYLYEGLDATYREGYNIELFFISKAYQA
jgi:FkbM family methyltransferase